MNSQIARTTGAFLSFWSQRTVQLFLYLDIASSRDRGASNGRRPYTGPASSDPWNGGDGTPWQRRHLMKGATVSEFPKCIMHSIENGTPFDQVIVNRRE